MWESILNLLGHPEGFHWLEILMFWILILVLVDLIVTFIIVSWKAESVGIGTARHIGFAYSGLIFALLLLIDIVWILFRWNEPMAWLVLLPHFMVLIIILLWAWFFPYRKVRNDMGNVDKTLIGYDGKRKKYRKIEEKIEEE